MVSIRTTFRIHEKGPHYRWIFYEGALYSEALNRFLSYDSKTKTLMYSKDPCIWSSIYNTLNVNSHYLTLRYNYRISITSNILEATSFETRNGLLEYIKPDILLGFERVTAEKQLNHAQFLESLIETPNQKTLGILLAAGTSTRFSNSVSKQLYPINGKPAIEYSIKAMDPLDYILIVTNFTLYKDIVKKYQTPRINIVCNDINCRLESISKALEWIESKQEILQIRDILIHDAARPYITQRHITDLVDSNKKHIYSQWCLALVNGLLQKNSCTIPYRENYIELCSPLSIRYKVFAYIFKNFMTNPTIITCEFLPIIHIVGLPYRLLEGHYSSLRKLTTLEDVTF